MPHFRITIRHGTPQRHHMVDIEAEDLRAAAVHAVEQFPDPAAGEADLLEIRRLNDPEARSYVGQE
jgi:hypothetical protein